MRRASSACLVSYRLVTLSDYSEISLSINSQNRKCKHGAAHDAGGGDSSGEIYLATTIYVCSMVFVGERSSCRWL